MPPPRRLGPIVLFLLIVCTPLLSTCQRVPGLDSELDSVVAPYRFRAVAWEACALLGLGCGEDAAPSSIGDLSDAEALDAFFNLAEARRTATVRLRAAAEDGDTAEAAELAEALAAISSERAALRARVEAIIARQIRATLADEGITHPFAHLVPVDVSFPPVSLRIERPPTLLVVSPRERIESVRETMLVQGLPDATREEIEAAVATLGYSGLVIDIGGLAALYPPLIDQDAPLDWTVETAVHEWLHQYLAFTPLGFRYILDLTGLRPDYDIATMNETAAGLLGRELADRTLKEYLPAPASPGSDSATDPGRSLFNRTMRETRLRVDDLLAQGRIEEAEAYMEEQRAYLATQGYVIRKLNQAYFAFHGTYADAPSSVSPIGEEMRALRRQADSPSAFLQAVSTITSREDLQGALSGGE